MRAWLVVRSGTAPAARFALRDGVTRVGRDADNDVTLAGPGASVVSGHHLEIHADADGYRLVDMGSRNGTFVGGQRVSDLRLTPSTVIQLGAEGLELTFDIESALDAPDEHAQTMILTRPSLDGPPRAAVPADAAAPKGRRDAMVDAAVREARQARLDGLTDQTGIIMRKMLGTAVSRSSRKFKITIALLVMLFGAGGVAGYLKIAELEAEKRDVDRHIRELDALLVGGSDDPAELDRLAEQIETYQARAQAVQESILYRLGTLGRHDAFVQAEIKTLMKEFGAEVYSIPPEFLDEVNGFIDRLQGPDRPNVSRMLQRASDVTLMREVFTGQRLPPDLVYIVLVESAFRAGSASTAGAVGPWQFTPPTARAYGLRVSDANDERNDVPKSTAAAGRYIRDLILEFGSGSSVMLALAAYNTGPGRVKRAIQRVDDPIKQRNFWYLYRVRALPVETREYVPKIVAAIIIGRHPDRFGF